MRALHLAVTLLLGAQAVAQQPPLEFEAASVKRTNPNGPTTQGNSCKGGPGTSDPGLFTCTRAALSLLIARAYKLEFYELTAPEWTTHGGPDGYDISARLPPSTTEDQFRQMLQSLLTQRFQLESHWGQKKYPEYTLRPGDKGSKIGEVKTTDVPNFSMKMVNGYLRLEFVNKPFSALAGILSGFVSAPVSKRGEAPDASPLEAAIKHQLGLSFEKREADLRVLIVDKVQKSPTEN